MTYRTPVDIGNRACQHCGVQRIGSDGFSEDSVQASEIGYAYDKLRRAELRRNVWQFATKRACIRPIDDGTMLLSPELWSSTTTYGVGAIVSDESGYLWQSLTQGNLDNDPGNSYAWDSYFGPMTVTPYDTTGTTGYYAGEMVYETPGDGTYIVYFSKQSNNDQDPRAPSLWLYSDQYTKDDVVVFYAQWSAATTYAAGDVVALSGETYVSLLGSNLNQNPSTATSYWAIISQTLAPQYYDSATGYTALEFVSYMGIDYICILAGTGQTPSTSPLYWIPLDTGAFYTSLIDFNTNNDPSAAPPLWSAVDTYSIGDEVGATNGVIYTSLTNGNINQDPTTTVGSQWSTDGILNPWTTANTAANSLWLELSATLVDLQLFYPIGSGPASDTVTANVFRLPGNFLRKAPQDPKAGSASLFGAPTNLTYDDWKMEGDYIVSSQPFPIILRFVADVKDVTKFDDMFCELLGARIAMEVVERLTQSTSKMERITGVYQQFGTQARTINGIETGSTEPPLDDWLACRW